MASICFHGAPAPAPALQAQGGAGLLIRVAGEGRVAMAWETGHGPHVVERRCHKHRRDGCALDGRPPPSEEEC